MRNAAQRIMKPYLRALIAEAYEENSRSKIGKNVSVKFFAYVVAALVIDFRKCQIITVRRHWYYFYVCCLRSTRPLFSMQYHRYLSNSICNHLYCSKSFSKSWIGAATFQWERETKCNIEMYTIECWAMNEILFDVNAHFSLVENP